MPISKTMLAGGLTVALAVGGGATIAHLIEVDGEFGSVQGFVVY